MKKILITGGAGYFGSKLVEKFLQNNYQVAVYDNLMQGGDGVKPFIKNPNYTLVVNDIQDKQALTEEVLKNDIIIHAAALVGEPICKKYLKTVYDINTNPAVELASLCEKNNKQFLFLSTCSNYGVRPNELVDENSTLTPSGLYSTSKINAETEILKNPSALLLRCATLFGVSHRMRIDLTINQLIYEIQKDKEITIYGEDAWRPYIHVEDACNMIFLALKKGLTGVYNLGDSSLNYTKRQIVDELNKTIDFAVKYIEWDDPRDYKVSFTRIHEKIQYTIMFDLSKGIKQLTTFMNTAEFKNKTRISNGA